MLLLGLPTWNISWASQVIWRLGMWLEHVESHGDLESLICLGWDLSVLSEPQWLDGLYISNIFHREDNLSCAGNFRLPGEIEGFQGGRHLVVVWVGMCPLFCCSPQVLGRAGRVSIFWPIAKAAEFRASYVWRIQFLKVITTKHGWHWPPNCVVGCWKGPHIYGFEPVDGTRVFEA